MAKNFDKITPKFVEMTESAIRLEPVGDTILHFQQVALAWETFEWRTGNEEPWDFIILH